MKNPSTLTFRIEQPFDKVISKVRKKTNIKVESDSKANFQLQFFPEIIVKGIIIKEQEACVVKCSTGIKPFYLNALRKGPLIIFTVILVGSWFANNAYSEKMWVSLLLLALCGLFYFLILINETLLIALAESNTKRIFEKLKGNNL